VKVHLKAALVHHARAFISSLGLLWRRRLGAIATLTVIAIALELPAGLEMMGHNIAHLEGQLGLTPHFTVFLKPSITGIEARHLARQWSRLYSIQIWRILNRKSALSEFRRWSGIKGSLSFLGRHPLPAILVFTRSNPTSLSLHQVSLALARQPEVSVVRTDQSWLARLHGILRFLDRLDQVLYVLFALTTILIIGNTIRLDIGNAQNEIETLRLLGAPPSFIRRPFLYRGSWYGLLGGLYAYLILLIEFIVLVGPLTRLGRYYNRSFFPAWPSPHLGFVLLSVGALLGWIGAIVAVQIELGKKPSH
jgi:cell division transport system permease protein